MTDTTIQLQQVAILCRTQKRRGWPKVYAFGADRRLHVLRQAHGDWFFMVARRGWRHVLDEDNQAHREGPFKTLEEATAAARRWFLDNPSGRTAELLARHPYDSLLRELLLALNDGDLIAGEALKDRLAESGVPSHLFEDVEGQLVCLGIWPRKGGADSSRVVLIWA
jgi:hypothetical protein